MSLSKFSQAVNNVSNLPDKPSSTPAELKRVFDKVGADLKDYINNTLTEEVDEAFEGKVDIEPGKSLMTDEERTKLEGIEPGATNIENYISMGSTAPGSGTTGKYYFQYFN